MDRSGRNAGLLLSAARGTAYSKVVVSVPPPLAALCVRDTVWTRPALS
ncbi:hypothetical protein [Tenggerimyces flavus]|uniref:Uncharacterized protein n=1 Tax=Tenggerimyces flavus TaxID=1708749 RepID=A0ABV7YPD2_9ACTN|nr:hypothetical protein [Tenggerimyces flavus]MBM7786507.1 hypothetical protein [Tenggerimyces flavus]